MPGSQRYSLTQLLRVKDWLHILGITLLGMLYVSKEMPSGLFPLWALIVASLYLAHGYSMNTCFDLRYGGIISAEDFSRGLAFSYCLFLLNCLIARHLSLYILGIVIIGSLACLAYSARPLRLKRFIVSNLALNSFGFSMLFLLGFVAASGRIGPASFIATAFFFLIFIPLQLVHHIAHTEEDRGQRISALHIRYGMKVVVFALKAAFLVITCWVLFIPLPFPKVLALFFATVLLSVVLSRVINVMRNDDRLDIELAGRVRRIFRAAYTIYGLIIAVIFYI